MELLELAQLAPALVDRHIVVVRFLVQVSPTHQAEALAVRLAERRERRRQDQLLPKERSQVDLEVAADALGVGRRLVLGVAAHDVDRGVVLLGEVRLDGSLDRAQATAALLGDRRARVALEVHARVGMCGDDVGMDGRRARLGEAGVFTARIDGRLRELVVGMRADGLLQQRRYIDLHFALPSGCYRTRGSCPCGSARRSSRTSRLFLMTDSVFTRSLSSRTRTSAAY